MSTAPPGKNAGAMKILDRLRDDARITASQYESVYHQAKRSGEPIIELLIETHAMSEHELLKTVAHMYQTRFVSTERLAKAGIDRQTLSHSPCRGNVAMSWGRAPFAALVWVAVGPGCSAPGPAVGPSEARVVLESHGEVAHGGAGHVVAAVAGVAPEATWWVRFVDTSQVSAELVSDPSAAVPLAVEGEITGLCPVGENFEDVLVAVHGRRGGIAAELWLFRARERRFIPLVRLTGTPLWSGPQSTSCRTLTSGAVVAFLEIFDAGPQRDLWPTSLLVTPDWLDSRAAAGEPCEESACLPIARDTQGSLIVWPEATVQVGSDLVSVRLRGHDTPQLFRCLDGSDGPCRADPDTAELGSILGYYSLSERDSNVLVAANGTVQVFSRDLQPLGAARLPQEYVLPLGTGFFVGESIFGVSAEGGAVSVTRQAYPPGDAVGVAAYRDRLALVMLDSPDGHLSVYDIAGE